MTTSQTDTGVGENPLYVDLASAYCTYLALAADIDLQPAQIVKLGKLIESDGATMTWPMYFHESYERSGRRCQVRGSLEPSSSGGLYHIFVYFMFSDQALDDELPTTRTLLDVIGGHDTVVDSFCAADFVYPEGSGSSELVLPVELTRFPNGHRVDIHGVSAAFLDQDGQFYGSNEISQYPSHMRHHVNFHHFSPIGLHLPQEILDRALPMSRLFFTIDSGVGDDRTE